MWQKNKKRVSNISSGYSGLTFKPGQLFTRKLNEFHRDTSRGELVGLPDGFFFTQIQQEKWVRTVTKSSTRIGL
jgi:hypothetical protein